MRFPKEYLLGATVEAAEERPHLRQAREEPVERIDHLRARGILLAGGELRGAHRTLQERSSERDDRVSPLACTPSVRSSPSRIWWTRANGWACSTSCPSACTTRRRSAAASAASCRRRALRAPVRRAGRSHCPRRRGMPARSSPGSPAVLSPARGDASSEAHLTRTPGRAAPLGEAVQAALCAPPARAIRTDIRPTAPAP